MAYFVPYLIHCNQLTSFGQIPFACFIHTRVQIHKHVIHIYAYLCLQGLYLEERFFHHFPPSKLQSGTVFFLLPGYLLLLISIVALISSSCCCNSSPPPSRPPSTTFLIHLISNLFVKLKRFSVPRKRKAFSIRRLDMPMRP